MFNRRIFGASLIAGLMAFLFPPKLEVQIAGSVLVKDLGQDKISQLSLIKLHDQGKISTRELVEDLGLNYDREIKRMRAIQAEI